MRPLLKQTDIAKILLESPWQSACLMHTCTNSVTHMLVLAAMLVTSPGLLEMVTPFSLGMLLELLLGELGPEPGALLHADSIKHTKQNKILIRTQCPRPISSL